MMHPTWLSTKLGELINIANVARVTFNEAGDEVLIYELGQNIPRFFCGDEAACLSRYFRQIERDVRAAQSDVVLKRFDTDDLPF